MSDDIKVTAGRDYAVRFAHDYREGSAEGIEVVPAHIADDLLRALVAVMDEYRDGYGLNCVEQVRAAIAAATAGKMSWPPPQHYIDDSEDGAL